jgi:hypothetical protein
MKNLVVSICGDQALHSHWIQGDTPNFDLFVCYYGKNGEQFKSDGKYYAQEKGTKFLILNALMRRLEDVFAAYDAVIVPDDDIYFSAKDLNQFFKIFHERQLDLAQPAIAGWFSYQLTCPVPGSYLRFTNWVEIMTPCFSKEALKKCWHTFSQNDTNWGIDFLWNEVLGNPKDKIAIIDDVVGVHTRPCFFGDTYINNGNTFEKAMKEANEVYDFYKITPEQVIYDTVPLTKSYTDNLPSEDRFFPNQPALKSLISTHLRRTEREFLL